MARFVRYIGKCPRKSDNVTGSAAYWDLPGQVVEVPTEIAVRLLGYSDSFVEKDSRNDPGDEAVYEVMTGTNESYFVNGLGEKVVPESDDDVVDPVLVMPTDTKFSFSNEKDVAIQQAIELLERDDPDNFTTDGYPQMAMLETILGYPVSIADRDRVWEELLSSNTLTSGQANGEDPTDDDVEVIV